MSLQDKIAKSLLKNHREILGDNSWDTKIEDIQLEPEKIEYGLRTVSFGKNGELSVTCQVADTDELQITGLQRHAELGAYDGMIFPYEPPKSRVSFHMGKVRFPIDIIFVGQDGRITKVVPNIEPGSPGNWSMSHVANVVETNGGFCAAHNIDVGCPVKISEFQKVAQEDYPRYPRKDVNPPMVPGNPTHDRYKSRDLPDVQTSSEPMDEHFHEQFGNDPTDAGEQQDQMGPGIRPG